MPQESKEIIEKFLECINDPKVKDLENYLEQTVQYTFDSKVIFKNINEAQDYYRKERDDDESTSQWALVELEPQQENTNQIRARILHDNTTSDTIYTFSDQGKIQLIKVVNWIFFNKEFSLSKKKEDIRISIL